MTQVALEGLHDVFAAWPDDAPRWGDDLLATRCDGIAGELRKHLIDAMLSSRQPPIDGPEAVRRYILDGAITPLRRKWRTYVLDNRRRLAVRHHRGGVRVQSWVTRRVPTPEDLRTHLPLGDNWAYLVVYGGGDSALYVRDENGGGIADDLATLRAVLPVCDVVGWQPNDTGGVRWWSLAGGHGQDGTEPFAIDPVALAAAGGDGWGGAVKECQQRERNLTPLCELFAEMEPSDPHYGDELADADPGTLSAPARALQRHIQLATRSSADLTVTSAQEARQRLAERLFKPRPGRWSVYALDEQRRRDMIPSEWGRTARQLTSDSVPDLATLEQRLALPYGGRWLVIFWGDPQRILESDGLDELLGDPRVADVCSWAWGVFASRRGQVLVDADETTTELTVRACAERRRRHLDNTERSGE